MVFFDICFFDGFALPIVSVSLYFNNLIYEVQCKAIKDISDVARSYNIGHVYFPKKTPVKAACKIEGPRRWCKKDLQLCFGTG